MAGSASRTVSILGSTGSVGRSTVDLISRNGDAYQVEALAAGRDWKGLAAQALALKPRFVAIADTTHHQELSDALAGTGIEVASGAQSVIEAAERPADWVMAAIVGAAGLRSTIAAVRRGAMVAFANKECLVSAGKVMLREVRRAGATLLPVDSEHNAIFQVYDAERPHGIEHIVLTASGGPFRECSFDEMRTKTPEQALAHPNWSMGNKISIDSATMMNKGLEVIEAHHLFDLEEERIQVLVHPESVIHGLVQYVDGSMLAQLGSPDMRTPIANALAWPDRISVPCKRLDLAKLARLNFAPPDPERFPALDLTRQVLRAGGAMPTILNAANEIAVGAFMAGQIGFTEIVELCDRVLQSVSGQAPDSIENVLELDALSRRVAEEFVAQGLNVPDKIAYAGLGA
jgi:1-deoxy-D-xylulose-5-phosphate reductoisomerase